MSQQHRARRSQVALLVAVLAGLAMALPAGDGAAAAQQTRVAHAHLDRASVSDDAPAREDAPATRESGRHDAVSADGDAIGVMPLYAIGGLMLVGAAVAAVSRRQRG
ncbi:hypothetical protein [Microbacterium sp.]|uniref:hypothetical protein n=1 Tax=Microbacterium sp. TaxID=51671 RepID=UPI0028115602|nr:hypothetical protein [Microbacterium sp.]